jgi:hypothetical protein
MLGIGCPDRHALPRFNPSKTTPPATCSPPARAGSFIGATSPLPCVPAIVPSQSGLQTFTVVRCKPPVRRVGDLRAGKPPESKLNGGEGNEGAQGFGKILEVFGKTTVASEPGESALDHPAARQDDEALHVFAALDDLRAQRRHLCHRAINLPGVIAAIGPDQFEPREAPAYFVEDAPGPVAVLARSSGRSASSLLVSPSPRLPRLLASRVRRCPIC